MKRLAKKLLKIISSCGFFFLFLKPQKGGARGGWVGGPTKMKKKMDGQPSPRALSLSLFRRDETNKKIAPLFVWSFPTKTFDPPRSERDINLGRFARIECFSSRISSRCVIIDSRIGRGARVKQNPIRFWRQTKGRILNRKETAPSFPFCREKEKK